MEISQAELERRLGSSKNLVNHLSTPKKGRAGAPNLTETERTTVGNLAHSIPQTDLAQTLGISQSEVSACKTGRIGGRPASPERKAARAEFLEEAKDTALTRLMCSLGLLTPEAMESCSPKELSSIAANMAKIHGQLTPAQLNQQNNVTINIYAPEQIDESKYKVIDA